MSRAQEELERIVELIGSQHRETTVNACYICGCMFNLEEDGDYLWVDRYVPASDTDHTCEVDCHSLRHVEPSA